LFCIVALVIWKNKDINSIYKVIGGLFLGALGLGILLIMISNGVSSNLLLLIVALSFLGLSEALVAPTIFSLVVKYVNPKYFATAKSLLIIPISIFTGLFSLVFISDYNIDHSHRIVRFAAIILVVLATVVYFLRGRFLKGTTTPSEIDEIGQPEV
nr:hypothetical protein [Bacteroidota bacterium]